MLSELEQHWKGVEAGGHVGQLSAKRFADVMSRAITAHAADIAAGQGIESLGKGGKGR